jgi:hypothetical protein
MEVVMRIWRMEVRASRRCMARVYSLGVRVMVQEATMENATDMVRDCGKPCLHTTTSHLLDLIIYLDACLLSALPTPLYQYKHTTRILVLQTQRAYQTVRPHSLHTFTSHLLTFRICLNA